MLRNSGVKVVPEQYERNMSTILAIDTSTSLASVALIRGDETVWRETSGVKTHSELVLPMVQEVLAEAGVALSDCDALAVGIGPGSFTGVRTACGIAQGLSYGAGLSVVPVVTLAAMAQACREQTGRDDVLVILDAQMREVYWAQYRHDDGWQEVIAPSLSAPVDVMPLGTPQACGNGLASYESAFAERDFFSDGPPAIMPHAKQVARLGQVQYAQGKIVNAQDVQPLYLRNKVALTTAEREMKAREAAK